MAKVNPGRTQTRRGKWALGGEIPPDRVAWVDIFAGTISVDQYDESTEDLPEGVKPEDLGESVSITLASFFQRTGVKFILTHFTKHELDAFERIITMAINKARPIVEKRDEIAREAMQRGDTSHQRVYRAVPQLFERKRTRK